MYIGLDLGTSGLKGILIDDQHYLGRSRRPISSAAPA